MTLQNIPMERLLITFIPVLLVLGLMFHWELPFKKACYALARMFLQLMTVGYALIIIFDSDSTWTTFLVLTLMIIASSWIALNTLSFDSKTIHHKFHIFSLAVFAILLGGGGTLTLVTQFVLQLDPWYLPRYTIPLAGMIFATSMTSISLAGERLQSEMAQGKNYQEAKFIAMRTAMIPIINSLFAVGLVSLPGMMTGQILSGVSPFIAARYQIMVMCMLFGASGITSALFLIFVKKRL